ncbi:MAG: hypothetical protein F6J99_15060 [Moorea sp. SIO4G3]|nr:hypothetical protein [Moorena sp. SIO4G3]
MGGTPKTALPSQDRAASLTHVKSEISMNYCLSFPCGHLLLKVVTSYEDSNDLHNLSLSANAGGNSGQDV